MRNLLNNDPSKLVQHILVEERPVDEYLLNNWSWNEGRYVLHKNLKEIVDTLAKVLVFGLHDFVQKITIYPKELISIDNVMKSKLNNYNLAKGSLVQMQRKKT